MLGTSAAHAVPTLEFAQLWTQQSDEGSEIVAIDQASGRVFNISGDGVEVRDINTGQLWGTFTVPDTGGVSSVAVSNSIVAVAAQANVKQDPGVIAFFNASEPDPNISAQIKTVTAGALPDMVTFTPDGKRVLVANEGEPNDAYTVDPQGSISIIDISGGVASASVTNLDFTAFNGTEAAIESEGGRIFGPDASVAMDLDPEYITVSPDGQTAFVTLQENNAVARIDLATETIVEIQGLGFKDHSDAGDALDTSDRDHGINIANWPVLGMYQPDSIDSYEVGGQLFYVTANEGDGDFDQIYSYGARSFSIWDENGNLIFDSGEMIEQLTAQIDPSIFNQNQDHGVTDERSDDKGPEPEALSLVQLGGWVYALVGLERTGGLMVFDITDPTSPVLQQWLYNAADTGPEGIAFSRLSENRRGGTGYIAVANEISKTTTLYQVSAVPTPASVALMAIGLLTLWRRLTA